MSDALQEILDEYDDAEAPAGLDLAAEREAFEADPQEPEAHREPFALTEPAHFDWAARKLAKARAEEKRLAEWKAEELWKLGAAFDRRINAAKRDAEFFHGMIAFAVENLPPDAKGKQSVKTPHLTASVTHRKHFEWPADDALVAWARRTFSAGWSEFVRVHQAPDKVAIKAYVEKTGDAPDGLVVEAVASVRIEVLS
jgi:hypothetical protein